MAIDSEKIDDIISMRKIGDKKFKLTFTDGTQSDEELTRQEFLKINLQIARRKKNRVKNPQTVLTDKQFDEINDSRHRVSGIAPANHESKVHAKASWQQVNLLHIPEIPGYVTRGADKKRPGRISQLLQEGWTTVKIGEIPATLRPLDYGSSGMDAPFEIGELVIMKLPIEGKLQRDAFYRSKSVKISDSVQETNVGMSKEVSELGGFSRNRKVMYGDGLKIETINV